MRQKLVKLHRWVGLGCGLLIFLVCLSGALLVFEEEITHTLNRDLMLTSEHPVSFDLLHESAQAQLREGEFVRRIFVPRGRIQVKGPDGNRDLFFSPEDGRFLGQGSTLMAGVLAFHRRFLLGETGRWLTLLSCLGFLTSLLVGVKLWWPGRTLKKWKGALVVKSTASRRRLFLDLHRVLGAYTLLPLLLIAFTGLNYSKMSDPYRQAIQTLTRSETPAKVKVEKLEGKERITLEQASNLASREFPEASLSCIEPSGKAIKVRFRHKGQPGDFGQSYVLIHPQSGEALQSVNALELPASHRYTMVWALPLHRGEAFGLLHQLLWLFLALLGASLPLTGFWLWYSRGKKRRAT